jgi:hypothetical protein
LKKIIVLIPTREDNGNIKKTQNPQLSPPNPREKNQALDAFSLAT